jgi:hypothetical protein
LLRAAEPPAARVIVITKSRPQGTVGPPDKRGTTTELQPDGGSVANEANEGRLA